MNVTEFTIFFEDPFWVGVLVADRGDERFVARVTFGAEPTNAELLLFMRERFAVVLKSAWRVPSSARASPGPTKLMSAKRGSRAAARDQRSGPGKAIAATHAAFELAKAASHDANRHRRIADAVEQFKARQERKKAAKRGK